MLKRKITGISEEFSADSKRQKKDQEEIRFKADWEINDTLIKQFKKYEEERAKEKILLIPRSEEPEKWLAYHPDNPKNQFSPRGSYVYVTHCSDTPNPDYPEYKKIAAWPVYTGGRGHQNKFHIGLSNFSQYLAYAGEVHFGKNGKLKYFDNSSGTYHPKEDKKEQSGFEPKKFRRPNFSF